MRRLLVLGVALGICVLAVPANATEWAPPDSGSAPDYVQPLNVFDTLYGTLNTQAKKNTYAAERDAALAQWGIAVNPVALVDQASLPYLFDENIGTNGLDGLLSSGAIIILKNHLDCSSQGGYSPTVNGGSVILCPWSGWWNGTHVARTTIAHEYGHALGFYHGGTGVMNGAANVNDEERALAAAYYGG